MYNSKSLNELNALDVAEAAIAKAEELAAKLEARDTLGGSQGLGARQSSGLASADDAKQHNLRVATEIHNRLTPEEKADYTVEDLCTFFTKGDYSIALANLGHGGSLALDSFINRVLNDIDGSKKAAARNRAIEYVVEGWLLDGEILGIQVTAGNKLITQPIKLINTNVVDASRVVKKITKLTNITAPQNVLNGLNDPEMLEGFFDTSVRHRVTTKPTAVGGYNHHNLSYCTENFNLIYVTTDANNLITGSVVTDVVSTLHLRPQDVCRRWTPDMKIGLYPQLFADRRVAAEIASELVGTTSKINPKAIAADLLD